MSRTDLIKTMEHELFKLNQEIDLKIIKGFSYKHESKRHKFLSKQLVSLMSVSQSSWASKVFATFMF